MHRNTTRRVVQAGKRRLDWAVSGLVTGGIVGALLAPAGVARADTMLMGWDAVAQCESGGNWAADTGNGFYGGLQFKPSTWRAFGGVGSPAKASREEQIAVANRVLDEQGPYAWPKCGPGKVFPSSVKGWVPPAMRQLLKPFW
ncbi:transglycosylase family protein [[Mycobacterium] kokjensenii]|uniref:transglycosylase family protein n=1 Tax=[Mycobacterium] kokjensenii TaxID=3064287 RepID=UPI0035A07E14